MAVIWYKPYHIILIKQVLENSNSLTILTHFPDIVDNSELQWFQMLNNITTKNNYCIAASI